MGSLNLSEMEKISVSIYDGFPPLSSKYPWLVTQSFEDEEHQYQDQFFYSIHDQLPNYRCRIPELQGKRIRGFFQEWLILSNHPNNNKWSLWNRMTSKIITLPTLILKDGNYESIGDCCLSAPPNNPKSILLLTRTNKSTFVFCRVGSKTKKFRWTEMSYAYQLKRLSSDGKLVHSPTCWDGKVYALSSDGSFTKFIIHVLIVVKDKEVVITLLLFGACPFPASHRIGAMIPKLKGISKELYYISIYFESDTNNTPADVFVHKLDMTCINYIEREFFLRNWNLADINFDDMGEDDLELLDMSRETWEEIYDLKDAVFFVDLGHEQAISYRHVTASELGGYIHICGETGKAIYSYHVKNDTISLYPIPYPILPTECRLQDDHGEAKYITDSNDGTENGDDVMIRSGTNGGVDLCESHLLNIPFNVLENIMELCVGVEYMNFRAACKPCHQAAPLMKWSNTSSLRRLQTYSVVSPWLMAVDTGRGIISFTDPVLGNKYFMRNSQVPIMKDEIFCSRFGWLLCESSDPKYIVFFNPFTNDLRKLPELEYSLESLCFSAPPTSSHCLVAGFSTGENWMVDIVFVNQDPNPKWRTLFLGHDPHPFSFSTFYGEDLYALCEKGEVVVISNLGNDNQSLKIVEGEVPRGCCNSSPQSFLTNCDQQLLLVSVSQYGETIQLFKRSDSKQEWEKINTIGDYMIYVCGATCFCIETKLPKLQNKIFFPRLHTKNGKVVFYSLKTCMYHTFDGANAQEDLVDFVGTTYHVSPHVWIEPHWS